MEKGASPNENAKLARALSDAKCAYTKLYKEYNDLNGELLAEKEQNRSLCKHITDIEEAARMQLDLLVQSSNYVTNILSITSKFRHLKERRNSQRNHFKRRSRPLRQTNDALAPIGDIYQDFEEAEAEDELVSFDENLENIEPSRLETLMEEEDRLSNSFSKEAKVQLTRGKNSRRQNVFVEQVVAKEASSSSSGDELINGLQLSPIKNVIIDNVATRQRKRNCASSPITSPVLSPVRPKSCQMESVRTSTRLTQKCRTSARLSVKSLGVTKSSLNSLDYEPTTNNVTQRHTAALNRSGNNKETSTSTSSDSDDEEPESSNSSSVATITHRVKRSKPTSKANYLKDEAKDATQTGFVTRRSREKRRFPSSRSPVKSRSGTSTESSKDDPDDEDWTTGRPKRSRSKICLKEPSCRQKMRRN